MCARVCLFNHIFCSQILRGNLQDSMHKVIDSLLSDSAVLHDLYASNFPKEDVKNEMLKFIPMIEYFIAKFVKGMNPPRTSFDSDAKKTKLDSQSWKGKIDSIADIEENIWSPWLGLKGKVDLTVKVFAVQLL